MSAAGSARVADDGPSENDGETYEAISCHACGQLHFVNPKNGRVTGGGDE
jgi:hypothetical protein